MMTRRTTDPVSSKAPLSLPDVHELKQSLLYSAELGIDLGRRRDAEYFRWFLASLLFGGRISETITKSTYRAFLRHDLNTPRKILDAGWDSLVYPVMREGGYVRYDGRKSDQILRDCHRLIEDYGGKLFAARGRSIGQRRPGSAYRRLLRRWTRDREHLST